MKIDKQTKRVRSEDTASRSYVLRVPSGFHLLLAGCRVEVMRSSADGARCGHWPTLFSMRGRAESA